MSITLLSVVNSEKPADEYVRLKATAKVNLAGYAIVDRTFDEAEDVSNEFRHIFIFPELEIEKGDYVRLYTGSGRYKKLKNTNGPGHVHLLYWQSEKCVWNDKSQDTATLIKYSVVGQVKVPTDKK